jgi:hypothetical protein
MSNVQKALPSETCGARVYINHAWTSAMVAIVHPFSLHTSNVHNHKTLLAYVSHFFITVSLTV